MAIIGFRRFVEETKAMQDDGKTTATVLAQLAEQEDATGDSEDDSEGDSKRVADEEHEEEEEHIDERWLVSYADMMTLLFGLFVMLYSMASRFDEIRGVSRHFSGETAPIEKMREIPETQYTELAARSAGFAALKANSDRLASELAAAKNENEASKAMLAKKSPRLSLLIKTINDLKASMNELKNSLSSTQRKAQDSEGKATRLAADNDRLKKELASRAPAAVPVVPPASFMAFVMTWPTADHDIDLEIEDPEGKVFNFKKRKIEGSHGRFVLDTRRGPGAEIWQTDKIVPGVYKAKYTFYNAYGNEAPTKVSAAVLTIKGTTVIPPVPLDFEKTRTAVVTFKASADGTVKQTK